MCPLVFAFLPNQKKAIKYHSGLLLGVAKKFQDDLKEKLDAIKFGDFTFGEKNINVDAENPLELAAILLEIASQNASLNENENEIFLKNFIHDKIRLALRKFETRIY